MSSMTTKQALEIVTAIAAMWGENAEEAFAERLNSNMTDDQLRAIVARTHGGEVPEVEFADAIEIRDLWIALDHVNKLLAQRGCEHFDHAGDGSLTDLCDIVIHG